MAAMPVNQPTGFLVHGKQLHQTKERLSNSAGNVAVCGHAAATVV